MQRFSKSVCLPAACLATGLFVCMHATHANAQAAGNINNTTNDATTWFVQLGDAQYSVRDAATERLKTTPKVSNDTLAQWVAQAPNPEVRRRLRQALRHRALMAISEQAAPGLAQANNPLAPAHLPTQPAGQGVLGAHLLEASVQSLEKDQQNRPPLAVWMTIPGLPAEVFLRPGDQLLAINGRKLPSQTLFTQTVQNIKPGQPVIVVIERDGQTQTLRMNVADKRQATALVQGFSLSPAARQTWQNAQTQPNPNNPTPAKTPTAPRQLTLSE